MIYAAELLRKHGRYSRIWLAATCMSAFKKHVTRRQIINMNLIEMCDDLESRITTESENVEERLPLYLSSELIYGLVRVFELQISYLRADILQVLPKHPKIVLPDVRKRVGESDDENGNIARKKTKTAKEAEVAEQAAHFLIEIPPISLEEMERALAAHPVQDFEAITLKEVVNVVEQETFVTDDLPLDLNQMESMLGFGGPVLLPIEEENEAPVHGDKIQTPQPREQIDQQKGDSADITAVTVLGRSNDLAAGDVHSAITNINAQNPLYAITPTADPRRSDITEDKVRQAPLAQSTPAENEAAMPTETAVIIPTINIAEETLNRNRPLTQVFSEIQLKSPINITEGKKGKSKRKLIVDKRIIISSEHMKRAIQPLIHLRCQTAYEDIVVPKRIRVLPDILFKRPSHKFRITELADLFAPKAKPESSSERIILNKILGIESDITTSIGGMASATASNLRDNTGNIPSATLSNIRLESMVPDKTPLIPEALETVPEVLEIMALPVQEVECPLPPTPKAAPRPDILEKITEYNAADNDQMREQWGKKGTMKRLQTLWIQKVRPTNMHTLCNPKENNRLAAATCFRSILDLICGGLIKVKTEQTEIIDIRPGPLIMEQRQLFKESSK